MIIEIENNLVEMDTLVYHYKSRIPRYSKEYLISLSFEDDRLLIEYLMSKFNFDLDNVKEVSNLNSYKASHNNLVNSIKFFYRDKETVFREWRWVIISIDKVERTDYSLNIMGQCEPHI